MFLKGKTRQITYVNPPPLLFNYSQANHSPLAYPAPRIVVLRAVNMYLLNLNEHRITITIYYALTVWQAKYF